MSLLRPLCLAASAFTALSLLVPLTAAAQDWPTATTPAYEALLAEARAEGEVVLFGDPLLADDFSRAFERDTGIRVVFMSGTQNDKKLRFLRETEARAATFDVFFTAYEGLELARSGYLLPIAPSLVLPEVTDGANWREGALHYIDETATYLPTPVQYVSGLFLVNTNVIDPARVQTWADLLAPELQGRIISHDPRVVGAGEGIANYVAHVLGLEFVERLYRGQQVRLVTEYRQVTDSVARGTHAVGLGAHFRDIVKYRREGLTHLQVVTPTDHSGYLVGGGAVIAVPSSAPHPKAAMVFANWYLSARGQKMYTDLYTLPSDRRDVTDGPWPDFIVPQAGGDYLNQYTEAWVRGTLGGIASRVQALLPR